MRLHVGLPRLHEVDADIFSVSFAPDCFEHACRCLGKRPHAHPDACCQHGADVDLFERHAILGRAEEVAAVLRPDVRDPARWFGDELEYDPEFPSELAVRTARARTRGRQGCVFLAHDRRGCALHRAADEHGFDPNEVKPGACRLYPLQLDQGTLELADDFDRYSCAGASGPTVYRVMRPTLASMFGEDAAARLDLAERDAARRHLAAVGHGR